MCRGGHRPAGAPFGIAEYRVAVLGFAGLRIFDHAQELPFKERIVVSPAKKCPLAGIDVVNRLVERVIVLHRESMSGCANPDHRSSLRQGDRHVALDI